MGTWQITTLSNQTWYHVGYFKILSILGAVPKQCSVNRRKGDQSPGVDLHEHPTATTIDEHHPKRIHADLVHTVNVAEADGDRIAVKGVDAPHPTIVMLHDMPFLKIRRHQQASSWLKKLRPEGFE